MYYAQPLRRTSLRRRRLGNLAPPDDGSGAELRRYNDPFSSNPLFGSSGMVAAAETAFPVTYDPTTGRYTWTSSSFEGQTMQNIDASQQFPSGGFLPGGNGGVVIAPGGTGAGAIAPSLTPAATGIPSWAWWAGGAGLVALFVFTHGRD